MLFFDNTPNVAGYYWWLPKFALEKYDDEASWSIIYICKKANYNTDKVGLFMGPIPYPKLNNTHDIKYE